MTAHRKPAIEPAATFARRHIGPSPRDVADMLETVGAKSRFSRVPLYFAPR